MCLQSGCGRNRRGQQREKAYASNRPIHIASERDCGAFWHRKAHVEAGKLGRILGSFECEMAYRQDYMGDISLQHRSASQLPN
jgi:hypothetical protein